MSETMTRFDRWWAPQGGPITTFPHMDIEHAEYVYQVAKDAKSILEFGSGGSTIWLAQMCYPHTDIIVTVDKDPAWTGKVNQVLAALGACGAGVNCCNVRAVNRITLGDTVRTIRGHFDLAIVDGDWRVECLKALATADVNDVILHDSQRKEYLPGMLAMSHDSRWELVTEFEDRSEVHAGLWHVRKANGEKRCG